MEMISKEEVWVVVAIEPNNIYYDLPVPYYTGYIDSGVVSGDVSQIVL